MLRGGVKHCGPIRGRQRIHAEYLQVRVVCQLDARNILSRGIENRLVFFFKEETWI